MKMAADLARFELSSMYNPWLYFLGGGGIFAKHFKLLYSTIYNPKITDEGLNFNTALIPAKSIGHVGKCKLI